LLAEARAIGLDVELNVVLTRFNALTFPEAIGLGAPRPPQSGQGRSGPWFVAGPDLLACRGGNLEFPAILAVVDELVDVAAWLEAAG
jgi:hypothetical protein